MSSPQNPQDPLEFMKAMWSGMGFTLPGIMTPTLDVGELDKRIADLKAVEGWLRMNLNLLSASINALEVQRATIAAVKSFGQAAGEAGGTNEGVPNPFMDGAINAALNSPLWPWNFMQHNPTEPPSQAGKDAPPPPK